MYYVYILKSLKDGSIYKGHTDNLDVRLSQHNQRKMKATKGKTPWVLHYFEEYATREEAIRRERYLKSGFGRKWLKNKGIT